MTKILIVAAGGAVGAVCRYLVYVLAGIVLGSGYPFGTLIVNIVGSFVMGVVIEGSALIWTMGPQFRLFLVVGALGAFTTFSTFSLDAVVLYERGRLVVGAVYIMVSVICSIGALFAAMYLMRRVYGPVF